jgi:hypothetical protein
MIEAFLRNRRDAATQAEIVASFDSIVTTIVDDHTIEFATSFPPNAAQRISWGATLRAFLFDRFNGSSVWLGLDSSRCDWWPGEGTIEDERSIFVDDIKIRIGHVALVDERFVEALVTHPGFQWDGVIVLRSGEAFEAIEHDVRTWFDSINSEASLVRCPCDAVYPVADSFGIRYTNARRTTTERCFDVERVIEATRRAIT